MNPPLGKAASAPMARARRRTTKKPFSASRAANQRPSSVSVTDADIGTHKSRPSKDRTSGPALLVMLNKPFGFVSQFSGGGQTLAGLIDIPGVYPAGRLDKDSEGLLLLTNSGALQHRIAHPREKLRKYYWAQVDGIVDDRAIDNLLRGVTLNDGPAHAIQATKLESPAHLWDREPPIRTRRNQPTSWVEIVIAEGRNRQIRRMTAAVGLPTLRLIRHRIGSWHLADLECGKYLTETIKL